MAVRTRRLFGPSNAPTAAAEALLYTTPPGRVAIVKTVIACNTSGTLTQVRYGIGGTGAGFRIKGIESVAANQTWEWQTWVALNPGDQLYVLVNQNSTITFSGYGSLLLGVPT